jgi:hypothetical protein
MPPLTGPDAYQRTTVALVLEIDRDVAVCLRREAARRDTTLDYLVRSVLGRVDGFSQV